METYKMSLFNKQPLDIHKLIFGYLETDDLLSLRQLSVYFRNIISNYPIEIEIESEEQVQKINEIFKNAKLSEKKTFLELVQKYLQDINDDNETDDDKTRKYFYKFFDDHSDEYFNNIEEFDIICILPDAELIVDISDYNICHHGRECTAVCKRLYKYKEYYIVYSFDTVGDDIDVFSLDNIIEEQCYKYRSVKLYKKCITVHKKHKFDHHKFLDNDTKLVDLMTFFNNFYPKQGLEKLKEYIEKQYEVKN